MREPAFWYRPRSLPSYALWPLGALYGAITERRMLRQGADAGIPVICVGNYHVGGAGKTPTVLALTKLLREAPTCSGRARRRAWRELRKDSRGASTSRPRSATSP